MNRPSDCREQGTKFAIDLHCFSRDDLEQAGGKAANLGELIQARFPVPDGFVITTRAYDQFIALHKIDESIPQQFSDDPARGEAIRDLFKRAAIPSTIRQTILEAYQNMGNTPVAVRSSATAEDLPEAAFAGQQDSFLNVVSDEALMEAVRACWASLWSDRAIAYRERQGLDHRTVKIAVLVQSMVAAEAAGVLFTANPVTGRRDEMVIDASPGLGEAVVSGLVTPDHFVLQRRRWGWKIAERQKGRHEIIVKARSGGGIERVEGSTTMDKPPLPDSRLRELANTGAKIQRHFGKPQDIEWAWTGKDLFILQARPITALPGPPPGSNRLVRMLAAMFAEMFPIRPYPLDLTTWVPAISQAAVEPIFSLVGITAPSLADLFTQEDGVVIQFNGRMAVHPTPAVLLAPVRLIVLGFRYSPAHFMDDPLLVRAKRRAVALEEREVQELSWNDLLISVREALSLALPLAGEIRRRYYPRPALAAGLLRVLLGLVGKGNLFGSLLSGSESLTVEANLALEKLAHKIRSDPVLSGIFKTCEVGELWAVLEQHPAGREFLVELTTFLEDYGHREEVLSTALQPTWKDAPEIVLGLLKGFASLERQTKTAQPPWEKAQVELLSHPVLRIRPLRSAFLKFISTARCLWQIRENTHFEATRILPILRHTFLEQGRRLREFGVIDSPEEVFHLKFRELESLGEKWPPDSKLIHELEAAVLKRKELRASLEGKPLIDPQLYGPGEPAGNLLLRGTPGSPGVARGPVRVIHNAAEFGNLRSGEVLVAPYTNPAWTPLFQRAKAIIVDGGAAGSHAAIVAREYGLPAVMGTVVGTQMLSDGEWVFVDGNHGVVQAVDPQDSAKER